MTYFLSDLNHCDRAAFVEALGAIFEDSPWVAEQAWQKRPFSDVKSLHQAMVDVVAASPEETQLALIRAHPDLASKANMAETSVKEQAGAGLDRLSPQEFEHFTHLNKAYKAKFSFPFIIAVKKHTKVSILKAFEQRLTHDRDTEKQTALQEIGAIAGFRLKDAIADFD
jgi:2-oxo-4-hydroxy-4-carboxy-5-ureidoimidazoline decarboxylase